MDFLHALRPLLSDVSHVDNKGARGLENIWVAFDHSNSTNKVKKNIQTGQMTNGQPNEGYSS
jgi:hypothetical protein